jgi:hypothetical protein
MPVREAQVRLDAERKERHNESAPETSSPQAIVNGRLVGTRPDLHRVNSCTDDAKPRKTEQQSAQKDKT